MHRMGRAQRGAAAACALLGALAVCVCVLTARGADGCPAGDLLRARQRVPRPEWKGVDFEDMSATLTGKLRDAGHTVRACEAWAVADLLALQTAVFEGADPDLLDAYAAASDNRRQRFGSMAELEAHRRDMHEVASREAGAGDVRRDGLCHETVMWFVHHLTTDAQRAFAAAGVAIPSLPTAKHEGGCSDGKGDMCRVMEEYNHQVSCQQCHTGTISDPKWADAGLAPPLPVDEKHPGRERLRSCTFRDDPPCGPCEGLGGRRWGDSPEEMDPMPCRVIHGPEGERKTLGKYPDMGVANFTFETSSRVQDPDKKGTYTTFRAKISTGYTPETLRMRYDIDTFNNGTTSAMISMQTVEQAERMDPGIMAHVSPSSCSCGRAIAGVMHSRSFEMDDPLDPLKLPAEQGGAAYLGRVEVRLDGDTPAGRRTVIADHYLEWAFHFLVDADENSPSFGLPVRLYASGGVLQIFEEWTLGDPEQAQPDIWALPDGCELKAPACGSHAAA